MGTTTTTSPPARGASPHNTDTEVESAPASIPGGQERERRGRRRRRGVLNNLLDREEIPGDLIFMAINVCVAGAVLGTGFFLSSVPERPLYGTLSSTSTVDIHRAKYIGFLLALIAGGYVIGITALGLLSRKLRSRPLYGVYNALSFLGVGLCMLTAIWPNLLATSHHSFCTTAAEKCESVKDLSLCPYSTSKVTFARPVLADRRVFALNAHLEEGRRAGTTMVRRHAATVGVDAGPLDEAAVPLPGMRRALGSESQCCYTPDFKVACGHLYGAAWLLTVLASTLVCVVAAQSTLACGVLCWDTDLFASPRQPSQRTEGGGDVTAAPASTLPSKEAKGGDEAGSVLVSSPVRSVLVPSHPSSPEEVGRQDEKMENGGPNRGDLDA